MAEFFQKVADFFAPQFDRNQTKIACRSAVSRLNLQKNKMQNKLMQDAKDIAALVHADKEELARIRVEVYMNDEKFVHTCELVGLMCEKVVIRLELLAMQPTLPEELKEAVHTIVYAAPRMEVEELKQIAHQMGLKYGREWLEEHQFGSPHVNKVVREKLEVSTPDPSLVQQYLDTIVDFCGGLQRQKHEAHHANKGGNAGNPGNPGAGGGGGGVGGGGAGPGGPGNAPAAADLDALFPAPPDTLKGNGPGGNGGNNNSNNFGGGGGGGGGYGVPANDLGAAPPPAGPSPGLGGIGGPGFPSLPPVAPSAGAQDLAPAPAPAPGGGDDELDMASLMARFDALRNKSDSLN